MTKAITINHAYPWGRSFDEYCRMFALSEQDLHSRIIGCADGPAALNAEMHRRGMSVVSCDPLYRFSADEIRVRVVATADELVAAARAAADRFVWDLITSPEQLGRIRLAAMEVFLGDYEAGRRQGRYLPHALPQLDLVDDSFDLALC
jgi:hypothetical protein